VSDELGETIRAEAKKIFAEVRENFRRLDGCAVPHDFQEHERVGKLVRTYRCSKCSGTADATSARWYMRGLTHGSARGG
jgi:hypothetical protein